MCKVTYTPIPVNVLSLRSIEVSSVMKPSWLGIVDVRPFDERSKLVVIRTRLPNSVGVDPVSELLLKSSEVRRV